MQDDPDQSAALAAALRRAIDSKTKPLGALGRIEEIAERIGLLQGTITPRMERCRLYIMAADHGVAAEGVSAYPQAVTRQMAANFLAGGAAANVFARSLGVEVTVVDCGVAGDPIMDPGLVSRRLGPGTANFAVGPAMDQPTAVRALAIGQELLADEAADAVCFGEMGIANTSAAALIAHKLTGAPLAELAGRGTGLDDAGFARKLEVLTRAAARTAPKLDAMQTLSEYGGFEIAAMAGGMIAAAQRRRLVLVDGFIATAAALVAIRLSPSSRAAMIFAHRSAERGHGALLREMGVDPLLDLGMRLGEGSGALLAWPLVRAAVAMLNEMASFDAAGVSGPA